VAAGKTVIGRELARRLDFRYLDTGVMYRAMGWQARDKGILLADEAALGQLAQDTLIRLENGDSDLVTVDGRQLGSAELEHPDIGRNASLAAVVPAVRRAMVAQQRAIAAEGDIVVVGRDIGTVVLTGADLKVFLTAPVGARSRRRWREIRDRGQEIRDRGQEVDFEQVLEETIARDHRDSTRADSPLAVAEDAVTVDTGGLTIEQSVQTILDLIASRKTP
jgi:cytidylate kinase